MAKTSVEQWDTTAGNNKDVGGINIDEGMSPGDVNNALREVMAQLKTFSTSVIPTGVTASYVGATAPSGWLLLNGDTLGSAASTATQKSDDYQTLYELIWNSLADADAPVEGGRGLTAAADFTGNKKLTMPDARGRVIAGKEVTQSLLTAAISGLDSSTLGKTGGDQRAQDHTHNITLSQHSGVNDVDEQNSNSPEHYLRQPVDQTVGSGNPNGTKHGGDSANVQPTMILNWIIKT